jgi:hypothetical protein
MSDDPEAPRTFFHPIEVKKVAIACCNSFALINDTPDSSEQCREQRLQMAVGEKRWRGVAGLRDDGHG